MLFQGINKVNDAIYFDNHKKIFEQADRIYTSQGTFEMDYDEIMDYYNEICMKEEGSFAIETAYKFPFGRGSFTYDDCYFLGTMVYQCDSYIADDEIYLGIYGDSLIYDYAVERYNAEDCSSTEVFNLIWNHDFEKEPVPVKFEYYLFGQKIEFNFVVKGIKNSRSSFFVSNKIPYEFFSQYVEGLERKTLYDNYSEDDLAIIEYPCLTYSEEVFVDSSAASKYLSKNYPRYIYSVEDGLFYICATNKLKVDVNQVNEFFSKQDDIYAVSTNKNNIWYLLDEDYFVENKYTYYGDLKLKKINDIILSLDEYKLIYNKETVDKNDIGERVDYLGDAFTLKGVIEGISMNFVTYEYCEEYNFFTSLPYIRVKDFTKINEICDEFNRHKELSLTFDYYDIEYNLYKLYLQYVAIKENNLLFQSLAINYRLISIVVFALLALVLIIDSSLLYTTLAYAKVKTIGYRITSILTSIFFIFITLFILKNNTSIIDNYVLKDINMLVTSSYIGKESFKVTLTYNYMYIPIIILVVGELKNAKWIIDLFRKLFQKVSKRTA